MRKRPLIFLVYILFAIIAMTLVFAVLAYEAGVRYYEDDIDEEFIVTFHYYDNITNENTLYSGNKLILPSDTDREGYIFHGWYYDAEFLSEFDENAIVLMSFDLYGKWVSKQNFLVKIRDWDGSIVFNDGIEEGEKLSDFISSIPILNRYDECYENGYYSFIMGSESIDLSAYKVTDDLTIDISYNYPISNREFFNFVEIDDEYLISAISSISLDKDIYLPPSYGGKIIKGIEDEGFKSANIRSVYVPRGYRQVGSFAFYESSVSSVVIDEGIISLYESSFAMCLNLEIVNLPASLSEVSNTAFEGCVTLKTINVDVNNQHFVDIDGNLYSKDRKIFYKYSPNKEQTVYRLESTVEIVSDNAFSWSHNLREVEMYFADKLRSLGKNAFSYCEKLEIAEIPDSVEKMGELAFAGCSMLKSVIMGEKSRMEEIGGQAFKDCTSLTTIFIPKSAKLGKLDVDEGRVFVGCDNLRAIRVSENSELYTEMEGVLYTKDMDNVVCYPMGKENRVFDLPKSITRLKNYSFYGCTYLEKIVLNEWLYSIGEYAFANSSLISVTIPASVEIISAYSFRNCARIEKVEFLEGTQLRFLGTGAFFGCKMLSEVILPCDIPPMAEGETHRFFSSNTELTIYVPLHALSLYQAAWIDYISQIKTIEQ